MFGYLNELGLVLDILGVLLLWKYGLPDQNIRRDGYRFLVIGKDKQSSRESSKYDFLSHTAILLLIAGFVLQIFG